MSNLYGRTITHQLINLPGSKSNIRQKEDIGTQVIIL